MSRTATVPFLRHLRAMLDAPVLASRTDRQLLDAFAGRRDEAAFAALVRRHGPMVLNVCRHVLRHEQDAEDAFQAVFLVLARKAASLGSVVSVIGWLHAVAHRTALSARKSAARRQAHRNPPPTAAAPEQPVAEAALRELQALLDAEVAQLPEKLRAPFVLCCLEGRGKAEAARELGWKEGTVSSRLAQARERLRARLLRRGVTLSAALAAAALTRGSTSAALCAATVRACVQFAVTAAPTRTAEVLALEVLRSMTAKHGKLAAVFLILAASAVGYGVSGIGEPPQENSERPADQPQTESQKLAADQHGDPLPERAVARLGTVRFNHGDGLNALYFLPDGKTILSEGGGSICHWDAESGKELDRSATAKPSFDDQTFLAPDGKTLTSLNQGWDDSIRVWDIGQRKEIRAVEIPLRSGFNSGVFLRNAISPDGKLCALNMEKEVRVLDLGTAKELCKLPFEKAEGRAVIFAGPDQLVTADKKQTISVWEACTGKLVREFKHRAPVEVIAASPDGRRLATLEHHTYTAAEWLDKDVIHVWDLAAGTEKHQLAARPRRWYLNMRFSPDGKQLLSWCTGIGRGITSELTVWDVETGERLREISDGMGQVMALSPDGRRLVGGFKFGKFEVLDLKNGRRKSSENVRETLISSVVLSSDGTRATTYGLVSATAWDASTGRRVRSLDLPGDYRYISPCSSPDGRYFVTSKVTEFDVGEIQVWDAVAGKPLHVKWHPEKQPYQYAYAFAPRSSLLACALPHSETKVHIVDIRSGKEINSFKDVNAAWPRNLFFTPDGKTLLVAGKCKVAGYDVAGGRELFAWRMEPLPDNSGIRVAPVGGTAVEQERAIWRKFVVSPTGTVAAGILDGGFSHDSLPDRLFLCDARTGRVIRRWSDSGKPTNSYEELAFSADGRLLATSDADHVIRVWEVATGKELYTFKGHRGEIRSLAFSGDGRRLASSSTDCTVLVWDLMPTLLAPKIEDETFNALWADLVSDDAPRAYAAIWQLAAARDTTVAFLRRHVRPVPEPDEGRIRQHIADLDNDTFAVREKAHKALEDLGAAALPALQQALEKNPSAEMRRHVDKLLEQRLDLLIPPETLRQLRALHALELIGSAAARELLQHLAAGAADARQTREAKAALERILRSPTR